MKTQLPGGLPLHLSQVREASETHHCFVAGDFILNFVPNDFSFFSKSGSANLDIVVGIIIMWLTIIIKRVINGFGSVSWETSQVWVPAYNTYWFLSSSVFVSLWLCYNKTNILNWKCNYTSERIKNNATLSFLFLYTEPNRIKYMQVWVALTSRRHHDWL